MDLQRADAGGQFNQARRRGGAQGFRQQVHAHAQTYVERHRAIFDQEIVVACAAINGVATLSDDGRTRRAPRRWTCNRIGGARDGRKAQTVAGLQLTELPKILVRRHGRADEAAQTRSVRPQQDRHVAGEIDRADGVGVVVDI